MVVGFLAALMIFSFAHLSTAGSDYKILTTSDSGYFYGIARDANELDGLADTYELSHPPQGKSVPNQGQFQPIMLVMFYRGVHSLNSSVSLMDASQYFAPFLFMLALVGIFLAGRELGGNLAGGASALFMSTLVGSIYWTKIGAFDREISLIFFGAWMFYLTVKLFNSSKQEIWKYSILTGLVYGLFLITWGGALFIAPILILPLVLILLERATSGLGISILGVFLIWFGSHVSAGSELFLAIGTAAFLIGLFKIATNWDALSKIENRIFASIRSHLHLIGGIAVMFLVTTLLAITIGGYKPDFWIDFAQRIGGFLGLGGGGGGLASPQVATEMQVPKNYLSSLNTQLFRNVLLFRITLIFSSFAILKAFWTRKKHELLLITWLIIPAAMATTQARFFRVFWPMWPALAAYGVWTIIRICRRLMKTPTLMTSKWLDRFRQPLVFALITIVFIAPFIYNARANATDTYPTPHGGTRPSVYHSLVESYNWIRENTPENAVIAVEWSYGHLLTGVSKRRSVTDGATQTGIWENKNLPPPDYVRLDVNEDGKITAVDDTDGDGEWEMTGEGRRATVQKFYSTTDENWFRETLSTYRDNYGLKIDYMVFNLGREINYLNSRLSNVREFEESSVKAGSQVVYQLENENILWYYGTSYATYIQDGGAGLPVRVIFYDASRRRITGWSSFDPSQYAHKTLIVYHSRGQFVTDNQGVPMANFADQAVPMLTHIKQEYAVPNFLEEVFKSPHGQVEVYRVNHAPQLTSPTNEAKTADNTPSFGWSDSIGGVKYEFALDNNSDFSSPKMLENTSATSYTPTTSLADDDYYWRVRAFNRDNEATGLSDTYSFTIDTVAPNTPVLSSPSDNSTLSDNTPAFQWNEVGGVKDYELLLDNNPGFTSPEIQTVITENTYTPKESLDDDNYWWKIQARDAAGNKSPWSDAWSFTLQT